MFRTLKETERLCTEIEKNRRAINDLTIELRKVESKTETMIIESAPRIVARTLRLPTSQLVRLILDHLKIRVVHNRENYTLEKEKGDG